MISRVLVATGLLCVRAKESIEDELNQVKNNGVGSHHHQAQHGSQSGNYQQYMKEYAGGQGGSGGYQQYMKKYAGGSQGGSQSGDYQQYMNKYAGGQGGGYQQYMKKYAGGSQGGSQSGGYQQYMNKYAGGGQGGSGGSELNLNSKDSQGGYQQYMKQYAGGQGGSSGGSGDYQKYMNQYAGKYMKGYAGSKGGSQSGDYQQYMKKYAQGGNYQKYMKQYGGGGHGGSQSSDSSATELLETSDSSMGSELNLDAGEQSQQKGNYQNYYKQYAGNYANYENMNNKECSKEVGKASDAKTKDQLDKWYKGAKVNVKCYVPEEDVDYSLSDVHKQYKKRLHELDSTSESPLQANEELFEKPQNDELLEKPQIAQKSSKTFLAKSDTTQSEVAANLALFVDQVNSDPVTLVGMALLGIAFACLVFFAVRHRRSSVQLPAAMLG